MRLTPLASLFAASLSALVAAGCADAPPGGPDELAGIENEAPSAEAMGDDVDLDQVESTDSDVFVDKAACGNRWQLPASVSQAGGGMSVAYEGAGRRCAGGATSGAEALGRYLRSAFPDEVDQSIPGNGIQIYNCRNIVGGRGLSVHATGRAIDVFIPTRGGLADNTKGDQIANFLVQNADRIGIQMLIWDRTIWKASGSAQRDRCYQGSHPHNDHVHVEISSDAADMNTAFFQGDEPAPPADGRADSPVLPPDASGGSPINRNAWIGDGCSTDNDCGFSTENGLGRCFLSHEPASDRGFCTLDCAGICPDRDGKAGTFCVGASLLGANGGVCVAKAGSANDWCRQPGGFTAVEADRYVGDSGARNRGADVCLPSD